MIEVAIGLAMVFALVSLLVTALQEAVATIFAQRGRNLARAITSFVGDDEAFGKELLRHPLIVSLAEGASDKIRRPSYMSADIVVTCLVSRMVSKYMGGVRPATPGEWVAAVKASVQPATAGPESTPPNLEFVNSLVSLVQGVENDWSAYEARLCAWYDAVGERSIGWYKRQTQLSLFILGFLVAAAANINPIVITSSLWNDETLRKSVVAAAQEVSANYAQASSPVTTTTPAASAPAAGASATQLQLPALLQPRRVAEADAVEATLAQIKASLFLTLERSQGAHTDASQRAQRAVNETINLRDPIDKRRLPDDGTTARLRVHAEADAEIDQRLAELTSLLPDDAANAASRQQLQALTKALVAERKALFGRGASPSDPRCAQVGDPNTRDLCLRLSDLSSLQAIGLPIGWFPPALPRVAVPDCPTEKAEKGECDVGLVSWGLALVGWALTALAATFGAPFWFDLLGKLVKLRGTGARPSDSATGGGTDTSPATSTTGSGTLTRSASSTAIPPADDRVAMSDALNAAEQALAVGEIERVQRGLGLAEGQISGRFDAATRQAIITWQRQNGFDANGELTADQIQPLLGRAPAKDDDGYLG